MRAESRQPNGKDGQRARILREIKQAGDKPQAPPARAVLERVKALITSAWESSTSLILAICRAVFPCEFLMPGSAPSLRSMATIFALPASAATCNANVVFIMNFFGVFTAAKPCSLRKAMTAVLRTQRSRSSNKRLPSASRAKPVCSASSRSRFNCSYRAWPSLKSRCAPFSFCAVSWVCWRASSSACRSFSASAVRLLSSFLCSSSSCL
mmetsp:Transcript_48656/g.155450  ORF Transcript_48656/g.155450 Transcript_48656/m.155450 type:complete len:210 (+) Transcript_48656:220-849(+)